MKAKLVAAVVGVLALLCVPEASAQRSVALQAAGARVPEADAVAYIDAYFARRPRVVAQMCGGFWASDSPVTAHEISPASVSITFCRGDVVREFVFSDHPFVGRRGGDLCVGNAADAEFNFPQYGICINGLHFSDANDPQGFANAWLALANPPPRDPATDAAFQAALQTARANGVDRSEENRRVQVQVEALVGANQNEQAATRYREALAASPDWVDGHYNFALLAGELGEHAEAITAMRRYLYLNPSAADARAAQDQIYRWEVLLEAPQ